MSSLHLVVDRNSPVPLYHQVAQGIEAAVASGTLLAGTRLDNEIDLAAQLNLSRPTIRKALDELVRSGLLVRKRGVGTQVVSPTVRRPLELSSLYDDLLREDGTPRTRVLKLDHVQAPEPVRQQLGLEPGTSAYHLVRVRSVDENPLALMENWVREEIVALDAETLEADGLYRILRNAGVNLSLAHQRIGASVASTYQAQMLGLKPKDPLVTMNRLAHDDTGRAVETGDHVYRADSYSFELTLVHR